MTYAMSCSSILNYYYFFEQARLTSASALSTMLDGPGSVFMQVAEYKEAAKNGSFTALSTSLGLILMQLHKSKKRSAASCI